MLQKDPIFAEVEKVNANSKLENVAKDLDDWISDL